MSDRYLGEAYAKSIPDGTIRAASYTFSGVRGIAADAFMAGAAPVAPLMVRPLTTAEFNALPSGKCVVDVDGFVWQRINVPECGSVWRCMDPGFVDPLQHAPLTLLERVTASDPEAETRADLAAYNVDLVLIHDLGYDVVKRTVS